MIGNQGSEVSLQNLKSQSYKDLKVWNKAMDLVEEIYKVSLIFPKEEQYGLTSQIRRSAISIPSNIAEGCERGSTKDFIRYINIAYASLAELETQVYLAERIKFINQLSTDALHDLINEIGKMLNGLRSSLNKKLTTDY